MQIPFHKPSIDDETIQSVIETLKSGWLTMGPKTIEFENLFKEYIGCNYAVSFNSCTSALHLALKAAGLKANDEVIIPTNTFIATAEVVTYFGAVPVLCDIDIETHNIDVTKIEPLITKNTKAIIPVHFGGQPCDMDEIKKISDAKNLIVIEDAAHMLPGSYKNRKIGTIGDITCFSFYVTKTLSTGEGGMATTDNNEFANKMKINRLHGISKDSWDRYIEKGSWYYEVIDNGNKYNTTDINSAIGIGQLKTIELNRNKRKFIAELYDAAFHYSKIETLKIKNDRESSYHLYVIKVNNRDRLVEILKEKGIITSVHFIPVHKHPYYRSIYGYNNNDYPAANRVFERCLSLPIYPDLSINEVNYIIEMVVKYAE